MEEGRVGMEVEMVVMEVGMVEEAMVEAMEMVGKEGVVAGTLQACARWNSR
jgi:hypothetical protein